MEYSQLSKIERGVTNPTISTVQAVADGLGLTSKDLFDFKLASKVKK